MERANARTAVDRDVPDIDDQEVAAPQPMSMEVIDAGVGILRFEEARDLLDKLRPGSIKGTKAQDWVQMGDRVYLQGIGVERIAPLWGIDFPEPKIVREDFPDREYAYIFSGVIKSKVTRREMYVEGGRSSAEPFFDQFDEEKPKGFGDLTPEKRAEWKRQHRILPNPLDVRKAACVNWMVRGTSMLAGLRGLLLADLEACGLKGIKSVQYVSGAKGGDTTPADLKAERTKLANDVLEHTSGDKEAAAQLLKEITAGKGFDGFTSTAGMKLGWQFENARKKLKEHKTFGDNPQQREPGQEG